MVYGAGALGTSATAILRALYPDHEAYVAAFEAAARHGVEAGFLLARDADRVIREANAADIP